MDWQQELLWIVMDLPAITEPDPDHNADDQESQITDTEDEDTEREFLDLLQEPSVWSA